jgi:hypothetical protein
MTVTTFEGIPPSRGVLSNANILCKRADACAANPALGSQQDRSGTGIVLPRQGVLIVRRGCYTDGGTHGHRLYCAIRCWSEFSVRRLILRKHIARAFDAHSPDRRRLLRAAVGAAILFPIASRAQKAEQVGSVEDLRGEAFAVGQAERRTLDRAAPLFINDLVGTGLRSRLTLRLGKDTTLRLGEEARLTIDRVLVNAGGEITLQTGPIQFSRPAASTPARMQIKTSFGLIAVRGTRFFAGQSAGVFGVFVERGSVAVSAAGTRVVVRAGQGTNIAHPGDAPTPAAPWGSARIRAALESVE